MSDIQKALRAARELHPELHERIDAVARIIDPSGFADDWIVEPESASKLHRLKLEVLRDNARAKADEILQYLGVNTSTDWYSVLKRIAEERQEAPR